MVEKHGMQFAFIVLLFSKKTCFYVITENREEGKDYRYDRNMIFF